MKSSGSVAQTFRFPGAGVFSGATINSVTLYAAAKKSGSGTAKFKIRAETSTSSDDGTTEFIPSSAYATSSRVMTTNPLTGSAWTAAEMNAWTTDFGVVRQAGNVHVTQIWVTVDYDDSATLTLAKTVTNDSGGMAAATDWTLTASSTDTTSRISGTTGAAAITSASVTAGTYELSESGGPSGYATGSWSCTAGTLSGSTLTLSAGQTAICTIDNDDQPGTLTIVKQSVGGDGTFSFTVGGPSASTTSITTSGLSGTTMLSANAGTYSVAESSQAGWDLTSASCTDGSSSLSGSTVSGIVIPLGGTVTCTFVNTKRGSITVHKDVVAPDGTTSATDSHQFGVTLDGGSQQSFSENASATYASLIPGTYAIAEVAGDPDFDLLRIDGDDDADPSNGARVTVTAGQDTSVTIVNKQKQGHLVVKKVVTNPNGGTAIAGDFSFALNGAATTTFAQDAENPLLGQNDLLVDPGTYTITEVIPSGSYAISYSNCTVTVASNASASGATTCTITNSDIPEGQGAITVRKQLHEDNGGTLGADVSGFVLKLSHPGEEGTETQTVTSGTANFLAPGTYTVSEDPNTLHYAQTGISCTDGTETTSGTVALAAQAAWTCTITNDDDAPSLRLVKQVTNDDGGTAVAADWTLSASSTAVRISGAGGAVSDGTFKAGTYALAETATAPETAATQGYTAGSWSCTDGVSVGEGNEITLTLGQSTTCTITNDDQPAHLTVKKVVVNDNGGTATADDFAFSVNEGTSTAFAANEDDTSRGEKRLVVPAGTYAVTEATSAGYRASYEGCSGISLAAGGEATCTITNDDIAPETPAAPAPSRAEGGNGPVAGSFATGGGQVLGASTSTIPIGPTASSTASTSTSCTALLHSYLRRGRHNDPDEVKKLQEFLNAHLRLSLPITGFFGPGTEAAVKQFQLAHAAQILAPWGLADPTGYVYKTTQRWINLLHCPSLILPLEIRR